MIDLLKEFHKDSDKVTRYNRAIEELYAIGVIPIMYQLEGKLPPDTSTGDMINKAALAGAFQSGMRTATELLFSLLEQNRPDSIQPDLNPDFGAKEEMTRRGYELPSDVDKI